MNDAMRKFPDIEPMDPEYLCILKSKTPQEKFAIACEIRELARDIIYLSIKNSHPEWDEAEVLGETAWRMCKRSAPREIFVEYHRNARK